MAKGGLGAVWVARLPPGADILASLVQIAEKENIAAGLIISGAGSLSQVTLRNVRLFPDKLPIVDRNRIYTPKKEPMEMLALSGNIARKDGKVFIHGHITVSSGLSDGMAYGGHLIEGCIVLTTAEVAIAAVTGIQMKRNIDPETQVPELFFEA
jgi:predicted DNA-binding protein with PD1-like motif